MSVYADSAPIGPVVAATPVYADSAPIGPVVVASTSPPPATEPTVPVLPAVIAPAQLPVTVPHFDLPFRVAAGAAVVVQQDTLEEITGCVEAILRTPLGSRVELPTFGVPDQTFTQGGADPAPILAAVQMWEPRATAAATADNSSLSQYVTDVLVNVQGGAS